MIQLRAYTVSLILQKERGHGVMPRQDPQAGSASPRSPESTPPNSTGIQERPHRTLCEETQSGTSPRPMPRPLPSPLAGRIPLHSRLHRAHQELTPPASYRRNRDALLADCRAEFSPCARAAGQLGGLGPPTTQLPGSLPMEAPTNFLPWLLGMIVRRTIGRRTLSITPPAI